jgi:hypothetical protein
MGSNGAKVSQCGQWCKGSCLPSGFLRNVADTAVYMQAVQRLVQQACAANAGLHGSALCQQLWSSGAAHHMPTVWSAMHCSMCRQQH